MANRNLKAVDLPSSCKPWLHINTLKCFDVFGQKNQICNVFRN
jgi:hypothetical protein